MPRSISQTFTEGGICWDPPGRTVRQLVRSGGDALALSGRRLTMAEVVIGIAASHAPNLANPSMMRGTNDEQFGRIKSGFAQARALLEEARPDAIVIFSSDHFDRCFYDNLPPFLVAVGGRGGGPINEEFENPQDRGGGECAVRPVLVLHVIENAV